MSLFVPLRPPLPRISFSTSSVDHGLWLHTPAQPPVAIEIWQCPRSTPSMTSTEDPCPHMWTNLGPNGAQLSSLALPYSQPYTTSPYNVQCYGDGPTFASLVALPLPSMLV